MLASWPNASLPPGLMLNENQRIWMILTYLMIVKLCFLLQQEFNGAETVSQLGVFQAPSLIHQLPQEQIHYLRLALMQHSLCL